MPPWSQMIYQDPCIGGKVSDMEQFAAKLEAKQPNPGSVSMDTAVMLTMLSHGDDDMLEKLKLSVLRSDLASLVQALEEFNKHDEEDLRLLRKCCDEDDKVGISQALRRMTGDSEAGTDHDEFKAFEGKGFVRRDGEGKLERLPFIDEKVSGGNIYEVTNCWSAAKGHNSSHIVPPALVPREVHDTRVYTVMSMGAEFEWEQQHMFNIIEANIANATGDLLTGVVNPNSGSIVMSQFDPDMLKELPRGVRLGE